MAAASNAAADLAEWKAEQADTQQPTAAPDSRYAKSAELAERMRHPKPHKPFKEMTGPEFLAWDNAHGFAAVMRPLPKYPRG